MRCRGTFTGCSGVLVLRINKYAIGVGFRCGVYEIGWVLVLHCSRLPYFRANLDMIRYHINSVNYQLHLRFWYLDCGNC